MKLVFLARPSSFFQVKRTLDCKSFLFSTKQTQSIGLNLVRERTHSRSVSAKLRNTFKSAGLLKIWNGIFFNSC